MQIEIRSKTEAVICGYVNAVGRDSREMRTVTGERFVEQIEPGTFQRALEKAGDVELRANHQRVLGSREAGSLELYEDAVGLYARALISDPDVIEKAERDELRGWSFGFRAKKDIWEETGKDVKRRIVQDMELREVSILDITPAYIATTVEMRGEDEGYLETRFLDDTCKVTRKEKTEKKEEERSEDALEAYERELEILKAI